MSDSGIESWIISEAYAIFTGCEVRSYLNIVRIIHFNVLIKLLLFIFDHDVARGSNAYSEQTHAANCNSNNGTSAQWRRLVHVINLRLLKSSKITIVWSTPSFTDGLQSIVTVVEATYSTPITLSNYFPCIIECSSKYICTKIESASNSLTDIID